MSKWPGLAVNVRPFQQRSMQASMMAGASPLVAGVAAELSSQPHAGVVDVFGEDGRREPGGDSHGWELRCAGGGDGRCRGVRWSVTAGVWNGPDPVVLPPLVRPHDAAREVPVPGHGA